MLLSTAFDTVGHGRLLSQIEMTYDFTEHPSGFAPTCSTVLSVCSTEVCARRSYLLNVEYHMDSFSDSCYSSFIWRSLMTSQRNMTKTYRQMQAITCCTSIVSITMSQRRLSSCLQWVTTITSARSAVGLHVLQRVQRCTCITCTRKYFEYEIAVLPLRSSH